MSPEGLLRQTTAFESFWEYWRQEKARFPGLLDWWDAGKARIGALSISYGVKRKRLLQETRKELQLALNSIKARLQQGDLEAVNRLEFYKLQSGKLDQATI
jgi:hypothetical protein